MISSAQCKAFIDQCQVAGADPEISIRRATATMAVCRALMVVVAELSKLDTIIKAENDKAITPRDRAQVWEV
jgi:hypothetical protein